MSFTCINCSVRFQEACLQREHYKTDWHRYNLKRNVAQLPPVTNEEFQIRTMKLKNEEIEAAKEIKVYCNACHKHFNSENAHETHLKSRKHKNNLNNYHKIFGMDKEVCMKSIVDFSKPELIKEDDKTLDMDSDEWEYITENPIQGNNCIFCDNHSQNLVENLKHMSIAHSFFIPDTEYCVDLEGLLFYLAEKVTRDFICLWCNDRGKTFFSLDAVRKHMINKGHCKMVHEGLALAEYAEFYDYSSSYPDYEEGMNIDQEVEPEVLEGDEYQLVLPSGAVIGHRSLMRYYKQRLSNKTIIPSKSKCKLHKVLSEYRSLGWTATQQEAASRKARDIHLMKRIQSKWAMKLGLKANKLQRHFRQQVNF